jgi:hypothetical protein
MRTVYPLGFKGDTVDICSTLRLFFAALWRKSSLSKKLSSAGWFVAGTLGLIFLVVASIVMSVVWFFANGTLKWYGVSGDSYDLREYRIPYLYKLGGVRFLPAFWVALLLLILGLMLWVPPLLFMALPFPEDGDVWMIVVLFTVIWPPMVWGKLEYTYNRKRFGKKLEEYAPLLARELTFPRTQRALEDTKEGFMLLTMAAGGVVKRTCFTVKVRD